MRFYNYGMYTQIILVYNLQVPIVPIMILCLISPNAQIRQSIKKNNYFGFFANLCPKHIDGYGAA